MASGEEMTNNRAPVLLDTSVWIEALRGASEETVSATRRLLSEDLVVTCGPVLFEIKRGLRSSEREDVLPLFHALVRLPVDETVWDGAGELDHLLRSQGITIPPMDVIISQVSLHHNVALFSRNRHFQSIPGVTLFQP
jgi:tRNA(fMet)-specific endonuclease VapC